MVEGTNLKRASETAIANFMGANIICRFSIFKCLLSNIGTPFVNVHV